MLPKCNENRKFQEESPPGQHLEKGLEACHGPCNQEEGRTDGACFAAGKFISFFYQIFGKMEVKFFGGSSRMS